MKIYLFFLIFILFYGCCIAPPELQPSGSAQTSDSTQEDSTDDIVAYEHVIVDDEPSDPQPTTGLESEQITYYSSGWDIHGTFYPAEKNAPTKAVILLPMLGQDRSSYPQSFIERLHDEMPYAVVLAIDHRGHGESTNFGTWENFDRFLFRDMQNDIIDTKKYITPNYPSVKTYYIVGASFGSTTGILAAARDRDISKVAMISPGMEYREVEIEDAVDDYLHEVLLVAASGDSYSATSVEDIEDISSSHITKKFYSGSAHGTDLFDATKYETESLETVILSFLKK